MNVELHSQEPHRSLENRLPELLRDAHTIDIAVAFVSQHGAKVIQSIIDQLRGQGTVRLLVSVLFPTHLVSIARLAKQIEVMIHLGDEREAEGLHGQFHSKIIFAEQPEQSRTIVVGSHNWTQNGLKGGNLEASVVLTCVESEAIVAQTRSHIMECRKSPQCELFQESRLNHYKLLQARYHPQLPPSQLPPPQPSRQTPPSKRVPFEGLVPCEARPLVILAEDHTGGALANAGVVFIRIPADWKEKPTTATKIWLFVFPSDSLFGSRASTPQAYRLTGTPEAISKNRERLNAGSTEYLLNDIERPCVIPLGNAALHLDEGEEWAVVPFHKTDQPEWLPLFHVGNTLPQWTTTNAAREAVPTGLDGEAADAVPQAYAISKAALQVPFQFAYPPSAVTVVERCQPEGLRAHTSYCRTFRKAKKGISPYVCSVMFQTKPELTKKIHTLVEL